MKSWKMIGVRAVSIITTTLPLPHLPSKIQAIRRMMRVHPLQILHLHPMEHWRILQSFLPNSQSSKCCCVDAMLPIPFPSIKEFKFVTATTVCLCRRGLSMFYEGKSQSFTSLSSVRSIEDLPKKRSPYSSRLSGCKSYAGGLDTHKCAAYTLPKAPSFKKASSSSSSSSKKISVSCPGYERQ